MSSVNARALAEELAAAYSGRRPIAPPSMRGIPFTLDAAYAVESELLRMRRADGRRAVGRKVGFANKAMWRILKLETLVWAHMYDDTVRHASDNHATLSLAGRYSPRIEPEIVFKLGEAIPAGLIEAAEVLRHVEWMALGFEINDSLYPDWKFQPADFVAAYGLHTALVVGAPHPLTVAPIVRIAEQLPQFTVRLFRDGELIEEGSGKAALRSPALCLGELAGAVRNRADQRPLAAGEIISTGTLTAAHPVAARQSWTATVDGLDLPALTLRFS